MILPPFVVRSRVRSIEIVSHKKTGLFGTTFLPPSFLFSSFLIFPLSTLNGFTSRPPFSPHVYISSADSSGQHVCVRHAVTVAVDLVYRSGQVDFTVSIVGRCFSDVTLVSPFLVHPKALGWDVTIVRDRRDVLRRGGACFTMLHTPEVSRV